MPASDPVASSPERVCPLLNGVKIPQVSLKTADGAPFELMAAIQTKARETIEKHKIAFTLLSDSQMTASRAFRIAYKVDDATLKLFAQNGIDLEAASGEKHHELQVPAVFLVATNGVIQFEYINPDYTVRAHPDVLLAAARVSRK